MTLYMYTSSYDFMVPRKVDHVVTEHAQQLKLPHGLVKLPINITRALHINQSEEEFMDLAEAGEAYTNII